jgi:predicted ATPase
VRSCLRLRRLLETVRQYGLEKLAESGDAEAVRTRHRDHYTAAAATLEAQTRGDGAPLVPWAALEMDDLRAAHAWSCDAGEFGPALQLVPALPRLWLTRGRFREGVAGFDAVFSDHDSHRSTFTATCDQKATLIIATRT